MKLEEIITIAEPRSRIVQGIAIVLCLAINTLSSNGLIFPYSMAEVSAMYPSPITPAGFTFSIWFLIFAQWIYTYIRNENYIPAVDYGLNALWVVLFSYQYIVLSFILLFFMAVRMVMIKKKQVLYSTWLCVAAVVQSYLIGGYLAIFITIFLLTIIANPVGHIVHAIDSSKKTGSKGGIAWIQLMPVGISTAVILWALLGIIVKNWV